MDLAIVKGTTQASMPFRLVRVGIAIRPEEELSGLFQRKPNPSCGRGDNAHQPTLARNLSDLEQADDDSFTLKAT
jgi:hypothetical protein